MCDHLERFGRKMAKRRATGSARTTKARRGTARRSHSEKRDEFRAVRHRLRAALGDIVDAPAENEPGDQHTGGCRRSSRGAVARLTSARRAGWSPCPFDQGPLVKIILHHFMGGMID
jgi:hypothetical protein